MVWNESDSRRTWGTGARDRCCCLGIGQAVITSVRTSYFGIIDHDNTTFGDVNIGILTHPQTLAAANTSSMAKSSLGAALRSNGLRRQGSSSKMGAHLTLTSSFSQLGMLQSSSSRSQPKILQTRRPAFQSARNMRS